MRLSVVGEMDKSNLYSKGEISKELPKPEEIRKAYFMGEWLDTAVYKRDALKAGNSCIFLYFIFLPVCPALRFFLKQN